MNIKPFQVEEWMNAYEAGAKYNIAETCVDSLSRNELFALTGAELPDRLCLRQTGIARRIGFSQRIYRLPCQRGSAQFCKP